ncbi:resact receptor-like [Octopus sinensis]|uniref:guanylate cyclase n=1 Tax=Octopus sinensis TaxID=2607531 RepID=A0A6P7TZ04_9MOLL|nr:resact receptor-like [Octopus sinensis]
MSNQYKLTLKGLQYLQNSKINFHGYLQSRNCIVDCRYAVKLMDFSPKNVFKSKIRKKINLLNYGSLSNFEILNLSIDLLWTAPEVFGSLKDYRGVESERCCDMYSFGLILQEIITREHPFVYSKTEKDPVELIKFILKNNAAPKVDLMDYWDNDCPMAILDVINTCIYSPPFKRPLPKQILEIIKYDCFILFITEKTVQEQK